MLGRNRYTQEELDNAKGSVARQPAAYAELAKAVVTVKLGERIALTAAQFDRLSKAFFAEVEARFR